MYKTLQIFNIHNLDSKVFIYIILFVAEISYSFVKTFKNLENKS